MSGGDAVDGGQHVQQRGLAGAGGPHDAHELAPVHTETDPVDGLGRSRAAAVIFFHIAYLDIGSLHCLNLPLVD